MGLRTNVFLSTDHLPTTYQPLTNHLPTTYRPPTDHLPTTYRPLTDHLPTTFLRCSLFTIICSNSIWQTYLVVTLSRMTEFCYTVRSTVGDTLMSVWLTETPKELYDRLSHAKWKTSVCWLTMLGTFLCMPNSILMYVLNLTQESCLSLLLKSFTNNIFSYFWSRC